MLPRLLLLICAPLCEPADLLLIVSPSHPTEGSPVTLTCKMPSLRSSDAQFQFCFFRDAQALGPGWSSSPKLQIANMWKEDSGSYWCEAQTMASKVLRSWRSQINVHRVPVADVSLETQPPGGQVMEGDRLVLICSVAMGTGDITFLWYKGAIGLNLQTKTQRSLTAEYEIPTARESDAEQYYCVAENGYGPRPSGLVSITVRMPTGARSNHLTSGVIEGLLGTLGPATVALLFCYGLKRKIGRRSTRDPLRSLPSPVPQEFPYLNSPTPGQLQPTYENEPREQSVAVHGRQQHSSEQKAQKPWGHIWRTSLQLIRIISVVCQWDTGTLKMLALDHSFSRGPDFCIV
ncbi:Fc receptor-like protein 1 isoform X17 [Papio anubis]|uniref:Fc receptor-like protein 1 isoform X17 n=1 Tax=Papio anubis TaxID=9555 RepID=UPI000B7B7A93|nr:Fc receptor-like protein 1 isoform X17 [Papio anubis]